MSKYRQCIQIGNDVTGIMKLPCVSDCFKNGSILRYHVLYNMLPKDIDYADYDDFAVANVGDWLCEDYNGKWYVLTNEEYEKERGKRA